MSFLRKQFVILFVLSGWFARAGFAVDREALNAGFQGETDRALNLIQASAGPSSATAGSALSGGAAGGRQDTIERLLAAGVPIDTTDGNGGTPLQYAALQRQTDTVRFLLQHGAKANLAAHCTDPDCKGHFAIVSAVRGGKVEIVKMLLEAGADPTVANNFATQKANQDGNIEMYRLLMQFGGREKIPSPPAQNLAALPAAPLSGGAASAISKLGLTEVLPPNRNRNQGPEKKDKLRLAIIADEPNVNAADLLTAKVSKRSSIDLVERQELNRILGEQKLTRQFAADAANYGKVAELLHADALLLVHNHDLNGHPAVESRLIRVDPGLVLNTYYQAAPLTDPQEWATQMDRLIDRFSDRVIGANTVALSFLNLRASLGNSSSRALERTLNLVLQARLSLEAGFVLLERNAMHRLMFESPAHPFCSGAYLVDGSIDPALDNTGTFKMTIRLQPAAGKGQAITVTASGQQSDPGPAINSALHELHKHFAVAGGASAGDSADEAQTYLKEAEWAFRVGLGPLARSAADSAWALGLHNLEVARIRALAPLHALQEQHARMNQRIAAASSGQPASSVHDWLNHPARGSDCPTPAEWLDLAIDGGTVWGETLESDLTRQPNDLRTWLDLAPDVQSGLALGLIMIDTAAEQSRQADRLNNLRQTFWQAFETARRRASELPDETGQTNSIAELEARSVRLVARQPAAQLAAIRELLELHFATNDSLTRAHIRVALDHWDTVYTTVKQERNWSTGQSLRLPADDQVKRSLITELRTSPEPDDRFLSGVLEVGKDGSAPPGQAEVVERIRDAMWDMRDLLAQDKETAELYLKTFNDLAYSGIRGAPFFQLRTSGTEPHRIMDLPPEFHAFRARLSAYIGEHAGQMAHRAPVARPSSPPIVITRVSEENSLRLEKLWTPFGRLKLPPNFILDSWKASWREGRIWLHGYGRTENPPQIQRCFFSVDPVTMETRMMAFPAEPYHLDGNNSTGVAVTSAHLVVTTEKEYLAVFDQTAGSWEFYRNIKPLSGDAPVISDDSAFLLVKENPGSALVRFDLKSRSIEVLASTRRYPAVSPLDDPRLDFIYLGQDDSGNIVVEGETDDSPRQSETYAWSPVSRQWRVIHPLAVGRKNTKRNDQGVGWSQIGPVVAGTKRSDGSIPLTMRLGLQTGGAFEIPLTFVIPTGIDMPQFGVTRPLNMFNGSWRACPAGVIFVPGSGGFWFVSNEELTGYLRALSSSTGDPARQTANNASSGL